MKLKNRANREAERVERLDSVDHQKTTLRTREEQMRRMSEWEFIKIEETFGNGKWSA